MIKKPDQAEFQYKYLTLNVKGRSVSNKVWLIANGHHRASNSVFGECRCKERKPRGRLLILWGSLEISNSSHLPTDRDKSMSKTTVFSSPAKAESKKIDGYISNQRI